MKRKNLLKTIFILSIFIIAAYAVCEENFYDLNWYKYANEYIYYDNLMTEKTKINNKAKSVLDDYNNRNKAALKLIETEQPLSPVLLKLLSSQNLSDKKVALVNIFLRKTFFNEVYPKVADLLNTENDYFVRFYCYLCFDSFNSTDLNNLGDDLISGFEKESHESLIGNILNLLPNIKSKKIIPFYINYFRSGSKGTQKMAYISFTRLNNVYQDEIRNILKKDNIFLKQEDFFPK